MRAVSRGMGSCRSLHHHHQQLLLRLSTVPAPLVIAVVAVVAAVAAAIGIGIAAVAVVAAAAVAEVRAVVALGAGMKCWGSPCQNGSYSFLKDLKHRKGTVTMYTSFFYVF